MYQNYVANKNIGVVWSQEYMEYDLYVVLVKRVRLLRKMQLKENIR